MLKLLAILFGLAMIAVGVLGFLPDFTQDGKLFGIFLVNPAHNFAHIGTGVIALLCGLSSALSSKIYFIVLGLVYATIAVLGFMQGEGTLLGLIAVNTADNLFHTGVAALCLYFGLFLKSK